MISESINNQYIYIELQMESNFIVCGVKDFADLRNFSTEPRHIWAFRGEEVDERGLF